MNPIDNIKDLIESKDMSFRSFMLTSVETRKADDETDREELIVEGKAITFNDEITLYRDDTEQYEVREVILPEALDNTDMSDVIFNYNHTGRVYARTRNNTLVLEKKEDGVYITATLRSGDRGHEELYNDIKEGCIDRMSFAFHVSDEDIDTHESNAEGDYYTVTRTIRGIDKIYDVSAVDIPAYEATSIKARNLLSLEREKRSLERDRRYRYLKAKAKLARAGRIER